MSATKTITLLAVIAAASAATTGCGGIARAAGANKVSPDEFRVVTQAPLTLPPDYSLRPPRPGEPRPQENTGDDARATLFGQDTAATATGGERQLVSEAGATSTDPNIRDTIDFESQGVVHRNQGFVDRLLSFNGSGAPPANATVDPAAEQARIAEEEATRRATGGAAVTIEGRQSGGFKLPGT